MIKKYLISLVAMTAVLWCLPSMAAAGAPISVHVNPERIAMGTTYNGVDVFVSGNMPQDTEILIRVVGKEKSEHFKKKGKALGVLWMNLATIAIDHAPAMLLLAPSDTIDKMRIEQPAAWQKLNLGFNALKRQIAIEPATEDKDVIFDEFLKLKQHEGLYGIQENAVRYTAQGAESAFTATLHFPADLPQGKYEIQTYVIKDGRIIGQASSRIEAKMVGVPMFLSSLAFQHGLLYGILAVLVAIMAGLFTGYLFRGGQEAH